MRNDFSPLYLHAATPCVSLLTTIPRKFQENYIFPINTSAISRVKRIYDKRAATKICTSKWFFFLPTIYNCRLNNSFEYDSPNRWPTRPPYPPNYPRDWFQLFYQSVRKLARISGYSLRTQTFIEGIIGSNLTCANCSYNRFHHDAPVPRLSCEYVFFLIVSKNNNLYVLFSVLWYTAVFRVTLIIIVWTHRTNSVLNNIILIEIRTTTSSLLDGRNGGIKKLKTPRLYAKHVTTKWGPICVYARIVYAQQ